jgi:hypothetical protein
MGMGSNTPGGQALISMVVNMLDNVFADPTVPALKREPPKPPPGGEPVRGPHKLVVWQCYGGKKDWTDKDKRDSAIAPALADHFNMKVTSYDCEVGLGIDTPPSGGKLSDVKAKERGIAPVK